MLKLCCIFLCTLVLSVHVFAEETGLGKIIYTQGHYVPNCRMIKHKENSTGTERHFRIAESSVKDDIESIVLTALISNRDVIINFDSNQSSGCGSEPKIQFVTIF